MAGGGDASDGKGTAAGTEGSGAVSERRAQHTGGLSAAQGGRDAKGVQGGTPWQALLSGRSFRTDNNMACSAPAKANHAHNSDKLVKTIIIQKI